MSFSDLSLFYTIGFIQLLEFGSSGIEIGFYTYQCYFTQKILSQIGNKVWSMFMTGRIIMKQVHRIVTPITNNITKFCETVIFSCTKSWNETINFCISISTMHNKSNLLCKYMLNEFTCLKCF